MNDDQDEDELEADAAVIELLGVDVRPDGFLVRFKVKWGRVALDVQTHSTQRGFASAVADGRAQLGELGAALVEAAARPAAGEPESRSQSRHF